MESKDQKIAIAYAKAWNNLSAAEVAQYIHPHFEYTSQHVFKTMTGKDTYLNYLQNKFDTIRKADERVFAELGTYQNLPCLVIIQQLSEPKQSGAFQFTEEGIQQVYTIERTAVLVITVEDYLLKRAIMCGIAPSVNKIQRSGIFPK